MRLTSFRVRRYKNVLDSTEVSVEEDVTALVGMNESGKSTMLDALYKLNPVYGDKFVERDDYPRWRWKHDGRKEDLSKMSPIDATFHLDDADLEALKDVLGEGVVAGDTVKIGRRYNNGIWISVAVDTERFMRNVLAGHPEVDTLLAEHDTIVGLMDALAPRSVESAAADEDPDKDEDALDVSVFNAERLQRITTLIGTSEDLNAIAGQVVYDRMPQFFRFAAYQNLEGRVDIASLRSQVDEEPGASSKQTARALLSLADTDIDSVTDAEFESRTAELEAVSSCNSQGGCERRGGWEQVRASGIGVVTTHTPTTKRPS